MNRIFIAGTISILILCQFNCRLQKPVKKYLNKMEVKNIIPLPNLNYHKTDVYFGIQHSNIGNKNYLVTFFRNELIFLDIIDTSKSFRIDFTEKFIGFSQFLITKIKNDKFYVLDGDKNTLAIYRIDYTNKKAEFEKLYIIPLKLNPDIPNGLSIRFQIQNTYEVNENKLFISYSKNSARSDNFFDKKAYLQLNIDDSSNEVLIPDFPIPQRFKEKKNNFPTLYLKSYKDSLLIYGFSANDSLYSYNLHTKSIIRRINFSSYSEYNDFDFDIVTDLAYSRKFDLIDERNMNIIVNENANRILILKRLKKVEIKDSSIYEYCLLDTKLNILSFNKFDKPILPQFCIPLEKGFFILDKSKKTGYYYE